MALCGAFGMLFYVPIMTILNLNHIALHVEDLDASTVFYRDKLGLLPIKRPDFDFPGAWFRLGISQELHLIAGRTEPVASHSRKTHFALEVEDVEEARKYLALSGLNMVGPKKRPDGAWQIFITDPDGYWIECCSFQNSAAL